jgi:hypothetical protein
MPVFEQLARLLETPQPAALGPGPRDGCRSVADLSDAIAGLHDASPKLTQEKIRCLILLWHDHLDAAHQIAQDISDADGSLLHAIMHRREPDYSNAKYWFHRVGRHPVYAAMSEHFASLLTSKKVVEVTDILLPDNQWDPFAFVDLCEKAAARSADTRIDFLRSIQQTEFYTLLRHLASGQ